MRVRDDHLRAVQRRDLHQQRARSDPDRPPAPTRPSRPRALRTALRQVFTGSTKAASSGKDALRERDRAARHDGPRARARTRRKPPPDGLEARGGAVLLVERALRVEPGVRAVEAVAAGDVVVDDHAIALAESARLLPERRHRAGDLVAEDARPRQQALLDLLEVRRGRCRRRRRAPASRPADSSAAPHVLDPQVALCRGRRRPSWLAANRLRSTNITFSAPLAQPAVEVGDPVRAERHVHAHP